MKDTKLTVVNLLNDKLFKYTPFTNSFKGSPLKTKDKVSICLIANEDNTVSFLFTFHGVNLSALTESSSGNFFKSKKNFFKNKNLIYFTTNFYSLRQKIDIEEPRSYFGHTLNYRSIYSGALNKEWKETFTSEYTNSHYLLVTTNPKGILEKAFDWETIILDMYETVMECFHPFNVRACAEKECIKFLYKILYNDPEGIKASDYRNLTVEHNDIRISKGFIEFMAEGKAQFGKLLVIPTLPDTITEFAFHKLLTLPFNIKLIQHFDQLPINVIKNKAQKQHKIFSEKDHEHATLQNLNRLLNEINGGSMRYFESRQLIMVYADTEIEVEKHASAVLQSLAGVHSQLGAEKIQKIGINSFFNRYTQLIEF